MRSRKIALTVILSMLLVLTACFGYVYADNGDPQKMSDKDWEKRRALIEENITTLGSQGPDKVDEWLNKNGIVKAKDLLAEDQEQIIINSAPGAIQCYNIQAYYDTSARKYLVKGWWQYTDMNKPDIFPGPVDVVSLAMCKTDWDPVTGYVFSSNPAGIAVYDNLGNHFPTAGGVSKIDKSGILYSFQDSWHLMEFVGYRGQVWFWLDVKPTQTPIYVKMDLKHTWNAGTLSSFSFDWPLKSAPTIKATIGGSTLSADYANQITLSSWPNF
jgi:hypothetical protein